MLLVIPTQGLKMKGTLVILLAVAVAFIGMASALPADNNPVMVNYVKIIINQTQSQNTLNLTH